MEISYLGHSSFRIKTRNSYIVTDPFNSEAVGFKFPKTEANIVTISHDHKDHNFAAGISNPSRIIQGPGEYEVLGISILGYSSFHDASKGKERGKNTIYVIESEGLRVCHLGDLGYELTKEEIEEIGDIDILMVPVGGFYTIDSKDANSLVKAFQPYFTLPMHYFEKGMNEQVFSKIKTLDDFLKDSDLSVERVAKLIIKSDELTDEQKIVVLERRS